MPPPRDTNEAGAEAMSDVILLGALRLPMPDNPSPLALRQFVVRARQAADRIEADAAEIAALRSALAAAEQSEPVAWLYKKCKPLQDEQIDMITKDRFGSKLLGAELANFREYARAVERAHEITE
jgi:hypothetical protein